MRSAHRCTVFSVPHSYWQITPALNAQRDDLRAITDSGESLLTILNDILDYSAIEAGGKNVSVSDEPFEPRPLLESTPAINERTGERSPDSPWQRQLPTMYRLR